MKGPNGAPGRDDIMPQYLLLLADDEAAWSTADDATKEVIFKGHMAFQEANGPAILGGNQLQPSSTATTVRPDGQGGHLVTDGAYAETKEALAGYYLVEAADLDAALALAKQIPSDFGVVEVRPVFMRG